MTLEMVQRVGMGLIQQVFIHSGCAVCTCLSLYEVHVRSWSVRIKRSDVTTLNTRAYAYFG